MEDNFLAFLNRKAVSDVVSVNPEPQQNFVPNKLNLTTKQN